MLRQTVQIAADNMARSVNLAGLMVLADRWPMTPVLPVPASAPR